MFIARDLENRRKPRRGGIELAEPGHAAPTGLEEFVWGMIAINMSLLRSLKVLSGAERLDVAADKNVRGLARDAAVGSV